MVNARGTTIIHINIACGILETAAVVLRLLARWRSKAAFAVDDWLIVASLIPSYAMLIIGHLMITLGGGGMHESSLTPSTIETNLKTVQGTLVTYSITNAMVKVAVLLLYRRIFSTKTFRRITLILGMICVSWAIAAVVYLLARCHPISILWDPQNNITNKCVNLRSYNWALSGSNVVLDVIILCLPLYMVWNLRLSINQKLMLSGMFLLGGFVCVASIMRIITIRDIDGADIPYSVTTPYIWSQIEPSLAIVCACLTTYRPLFVNTNLKSMSSLLSWSRISSRKKEEWSKITSDSGGLKWPLHSRLASDNELRNVDSSNETVADGRLHVVDIQFPIGEEHLGTEEDCDFSRTRVDKSDSCV